MFMSLPLLAQTSGFSGGVGGLVARSGPVAKVVLFLLVLFSLISWGIMTAFDDIGRMGSANLAVVAPGISEALITTATGLAAAIPAAVFFNYYSSRVRVLTAMMDDFAMEFLNIVERNFT